MKFSFSFIFLILLYLCNSIWLKNKLLGKNLIKNKVFHGNPEVEGDFFIFHREQ